MPCARRVSTSPTGVLNRHQALTRLRKSTGRQLRGHRQATPTLLYKGFRFHQEPCRLPRFLPSSSNRSALALLYEYIILSQIHVRRAEAKYASHRAEGVAWGEHGIPTMRTDRQSADQSCRTDTTAAPQPEGMREFPSEIVRRWEDRAAYYCTSGGSVIATSRSFTLRRSSISLARAPRTSPTASSAFAPAMIAGLVLLIFS